MAVAHEIIAKWEQEIENPLVERHKVPARVQFSSLPQIYIQKNLASHPSDL